MDALGHAFLASLARGVQGAADMRAAEAAPAVRDFPHGLPCPLIVSWLHRECEAVASMVARGGGSEGAGGSRANGPLVT